MCMRQPSVQVQERGIKPSFSMLAEGMPEVEVYENTRRLPYDMEAVTTLTMCDSAGVRYDWTELNAEIVIWAG